MIEFLSKKITSFLYANNAIEKEDIELFKYYGIEECSIVVE